MKKGHTPALKGKKLGFVPKGAFKKGQIPWNKGKRHDAIRGEKHPQWRGGITTLNEVIRRLPESSKWRSEVFERDEFTCQMCFAVGGTLHADHIKPFAVILAENNISSTQEAVECIELWDIMNGRTLCVECHRSTHTWGGNTLSLLKEIQTHQD